MGFLFPVVDVVMLTELAFYLISDLTQSYDAFALMDCKTCYRCAEWSILSEEKRVSTHLRQLGQVCRSLNATDL